MGIPTTAAYIIGAAVGAPILQQMGVPQLNAHMFVFYFSILADATPPVSVASYAAASIAKCSPMAAGAVAFRLAFAGFIVGFSYLHSGALLLRDTPSEIVGETLVIASALTLASAGFFGFFRAPLPLWLRLVLVPLGVVLALQGDINVWLRCLMVFAIMVALFLWQRDAAAAEGESAAAEGARP
jgi:TRAP-type uncharacterized transport system fused permease subunit